MTFISINDAFTNPNSPWYYVVGSAFLVLIIAALVIFVLVSKRKHAAEEKKMTDVEITDTLPPEAQSEQDSAVEEKAEDSEIVQEADTHSDTDEKKVDEGAEATAEAIENAPEAKEYVAPPEEVVAEKEEQKQEQPKPATRKKKEEKQPTIILVNANKAEIKPAAEKAPATKSPTTAKKPTATKKPQKPFIDRLLAAKEVHGIYNELKNAILSYPGMKAKLGKESESFTFAAETKAEISLDGNKVVLNVAVDPDGVKEFGAVADDGALKTRLNVSTTNIDSAQRLITYTMNISMLTRNDKHRHVDYIQNAINAKNKAKAKQSATKAKK
ncbi:MAG: hypothetical protein J1G04_01545 [Clostridiales bacterium]|nr:hypothetical protein [Clostridiales bacterium]